MKVEVSIDIEDEVRKALNSYLTAYCRPLPASFSTPCILITQVGGSEISGKIDAFDVTIDARSTSTGEANEYMRKAIGILKEVAKQQTTAIRHIEVNASGAWGSDPARPDLSMCSARLRIVAHPEQITI